LVAVLGDLPVVAALEFRQWSHGPIVDHQHIDAAEVSEQVAQTAERTCDRPITPTARRAGWKSEA
jgi:hypothetical protein